LSSVDSWLEYARENRRQGAETSRIGFSKRKGEEIMTRCSIVTIVAGLIILPAIHVYAADQKEDSSNDVTAEIKRLQKDRLIDLASIVKDLTEQYRVGAIDFEPLGHAQTELVNAQLDATDKPEERIALLKEQVKSQMAVLKIAAARAKAGTVRSVDVPRARAVLSATEIRLSQEELKQKPTPSTGAAGSSTLQPGDFCKLLTYLDGCQHMTSFRRKQLETDYAGKVYTGDVLVKDVQSDEKEGTTLIAQARAKENSDVVWQFRINVVDDKDAAKFRKGKCVSITFLLSNNLSPLSGTLQKINDPNLRKALPEVLPSPPGLSTVSE
jgi:hypothetical protein